MIRRFAVWLCAAALNACGGSEDLNTWIAETEQTARRLPPSEPPAAPPATVYQGKTPSGNPFDRARLPEAFSDGLPNAAPKHANADGTPQPTEHAAASDWKYVGSIRSGKRFSALVEHRGRVYRAEKGGSVGTARLLSARPEEIVLQHGSRRIVLPLTRAGRPPSKKPDGQNRKKSAGRTALPN